MTDASAPPPQTRGFLFADLRGYSTFKERHGDQAARELLARYRRSVRATAVGQDRDMASLLSWWRERARFTP